MKILSEVPSIVGSTRLITEMQSGIRVAALFPNAASCERLVTAVAIDISEEWITGRLYLDMTE